MQNLKSLKDVTFLGGCSKFFAGAPYFLKLGVNCEPCVECLRNIYLLFVCLRTDILKNM